MKLAKDILMYHFEYSEEMINSPYYLHRELGQIIDSEQYDALLSPDDEDTSILDLYIQLPRQNSDEAYQEMQSFVQTVKDKHHQELLDIALDGTGAFRRFKNVLYNHHYYGEWEKFRDEHKYKRMVAWLKSHNIGLKFV
jgi:hypothetical protein